MTEPTHRGRGTEGQGEISYWRGRVDGRLEMIDETIAKLDKTVSTVQLEMAGLMLRLARYGGIVAVVLAILSLFGPYFVGYFLKIPLPSKPQP